jgi:TP901 family phage tail tape measure protein
MADVGEIRARLVLSSDQFNRGMRDAQTQMNNTGRSARTVSKDIKLIHSAALGMGAAIAVGIGAAVKTAADFEQKMADVKAVSGATAGEMSQLGDLAKEMGLKTAFSATEAAGGIEELIKAGLTVTQIMGGGLEGALNLAVAGNLELADAAEIASTALNAFKADQLDVATAADILAGAANASATDVGELKFGLSAVSAVASGVGLSFKDTTTALAVFAQNGIKGSDAGTSLKTMLMNLVPSGKRARETMHELGIAMADGSNKFYDANGKIKSLAEISDVLRKALVKLNPKEQGEALKDMFGSDAVRAGTILFKEGAKGVEDMWTAMSKVKAVDVAKVKLDTFKGAFAEFQSTLESVGITIGEEFLPAFKDIVQFATGVVRKFGEVDGSTIKVGLAMAGATTAIALVGTTIAKLSLALRAFALTPAGAAITALSLIGGAIAGAVVQSNEMKEVNLETADSMLEQADSLAVSIKKFDELKTASKLSTDEFGRFLDINSEIKKTADPNVIKRLKDEQEKLREKSGLSNDQLAEMVRLNGEIIKIVPESNTKLTDQGNILLDNTGKAKEYNKQQYESLRLELEKQRLKAEKNQGKNLAEETRLIEKMKTLKKEMKTLDQKELDQRKVIIGVEKDLATAKENNDKAEIMRLETLLRVEKRKHQVLKDQHYEQAKLISDKKAELDKVQAQIGKLDEVKRKMVDLELRQVGINAKRGQEIKTIDTAISKLKKQKAELEKSIPVNMRNTDEYREAAGAIQSQIEKLQGAKSKVEEIIGKAKTMNAELGKDVNKNVSVVVKNHTITTEEKRLIDPQNNGPVKKKGGFSPTGLYHTGGIIGRGQMPMLHTGGLASQFANAPNHNEIDVRLLRKEMVLTEAQQANLMRLIDAGFTNKGGAPANSGAAELARAVDAISSRPINVGISVDGREIAKATAKYNQEELDLLDARQSRMGGVL